MDARILLLALLVPAAAAYGQADQDEHVSVVDVGGAALWIEVHEGNAYVANPSDGEILVIDIDTSVVTRNIEAVDGVSVIEVNGDAGLIYATADAQAPVYVYDMETGESLGMIEIGDPEITLYSTSDQPYGQREYVTFATNAIGLDYNPANKKLYAVHTTVNSLVVIDAETRQVEAEIPVGKAPLLVEVDESRAIAYVSNRESSSVSVIDLSTNFVVETLQTGFAATQMVVDTVNDRLFVTHHASPHVTAVSLATKEIEKKIQLDGPTHALALDGNGLLHVTYLPESGVTGAGAPGRVEFIDAATLEHVGGFALQENPFTIRVDPATNKLFATVLESGTLVSADLAGSTEYQAILDAKQAAPPTGSETGGGCLIATAAYGTEMAAEVQRLRELREGLVGGTAAGASFMGWFNDIYYSFSPAVADMQREHPVLKEAVRLAITPMVHSLSVMHHADSETSVLLLGISVILANAGMYAGVPALAVVCAARIRRGSA